MLVFLPLHSPHLMHERFLPLSLDAGQLTAFSGIISLLETKKDLKPNFLACLRSLVVWVDAMKKLL